MNQIKNFVLTVIILTGILFFNNSAYSIYFSDDNLISNQEASELLNSDAVLLAEKVYKCPNSIIIIIWNNKFIEAFNINADSNNDKEIDASIYFNQYYIDENGVAREDYTELNTLVERVIKNKNEEEIINIFKLLMNDQLWLNPLNNSLIRAGNKKNNIEPIGVTSYFFTPGEYFFGKLADSIKKIPNLYETIVKHYSIVISKNTYGGFLNSYIISYAIEQQMIDYAITDMEYFLEIPWGNDKKKDGIWSIRDDINKLKNDIGEPHDPNPHPDNYYRRY